MTNENMSEDNHSDYVKKTIFEFCSTIREHFENMDNEKIENHMRKGSIIDLRKAIETITKRWERERLSYDKIHEIEIEDAIQLLHDEKALILEAITWYIILNERIDVELHPMYRETWKPIMSWPEGKEETIKL